MSKLITISEREAMVILTQKEAIAAEKRWNKFIHKTFGMTIEEINREAETKYAIKKGDCRLTRLRKREQKALFIERLKVKYGLAGRGEKVN